MTVAQFVSIEGGEACGKSTQAALLAEYLDALHTREPGGTVLGERVRNLVLDGSLGVVDPRAEALLMAAARAQHVAQVIQPTLDSGRHVVTERFTESSLAYQGYGRGLNVDELRRVSLWASAGLQADVVILLTVSNEIAGQRMQGRSLDRFESDGMDFHDRVKAGFLALAQTEPERWLIVDGGRSIDDVQQTIREGLLARGLYG